MNKPENPSVFPMGTELPEKYRSYFTGQAYLQALTDRGGPISNVTFEPGGQILLVTGGRGWYQTWNGKAQELHPGDVVMIPPEVKHWHGAAKDSWFSHLAVSVTAEGAYCEWLEAVPEEEYGKLDQQ